MIWRMPVFVKMAKQTLQLLLIIQTGTQFAPSVDMFSSHNNLTTFISKAKGTKNCYFPPRLQTQETNSEKAPVEGIEVVDTMADRLELSEAIRKRGHQMFTQMEEQKCRTDRNQDALAAGCLFIAAREHSLPRTLKEMCIASYGLSMKEVNKGVQLNYKEATRFGHGSYGLH